MAHHQIIPDTHTVPYDPFPNNDISALDGGRFDYPTARVHDRQGNAVEESQEDEHRQGGRTILACLDFHRDDHLQSVLKEVKAIAKPADTVILFNALNTEKHPEEKGIADQRVKHIIKFATDFPEGTRVLTHVVYAKPYEIALQVAQKHKVSLIVLGKRNLRGIKKLTSNSVSDHVIEAAQCSVLIAK